MDEVTQNFDQQTPPLSMKVITLTESIAGSVHSGVRANKWMMSETGLHKDQINVWFTNNGIRQGFPAAHRLTAPPASDNTSTDAWQASSTVSAAARL
jgi:hypothetical protein